MVGAGPRGCRDMLARVSIVNTFGNVVYDKYVQPIHPVTDYRSFVSGIYPHHLQEHAVPFAVVQREVSFIFICYDSLHTKVAQEIGSHTYC